MCVYIYIYIFTYTCRCVYTYIYIYTLCVSGDPDFRQEIDVFIKENKSTRGFCRAPSSDKYLSRAGARDAPSESVGDAYKQKQPSTTIQRQQATIKRQQTRHTTINRQQTTIKTTTMLNRTTIQRRQTINTHQTVCWKARSHEVHMSSWAAATVSALK